MNHFIDALKQYANFKGRATRTQFWMYQLFYVITLIVASVADALSGLPFLTLICVLGFFIPSLSIGARRLHDIGRSGWWQLLMFVPMIGGIVLLVFWVMESKGDNEYGVSTVISGSA